MNSPKDFLEGNSHEEISRSVVHHLTENNSPVGAVLKTQAGYFWLDFRNEIYSNSFFRTLKETVSEFNMWLESEQKYGGGEPH